MTETEARELARQRFKGRCSCWRRCQVEECSKLKEEYPEFTWLPSPGGIIAFRKSKPDEDES